MMPLCTCGSCKIVSLLWHWLSLKLFLDFLVQQPALQAKTRDLAEAYKDITAAKKCIQNIRNDDSWEKV